MRTTDTARLPRYVGTAVVAQILGYSGETIRNWSANGTLPKPIKIGRHRRWPLETILNFAREHGIDVEEVARD